MCIFVSSSRLPVCLEKLWFIYTTSRNHPLDGSVVCYRLEWWGPTSYRPATFYNKKGLLCSGEV